MVRTSRMLIAASVVGLLVSGCTVKKTEQPPLTGPSELALSVNLTANPDILTQDGSSQSRIVIMALDATSQPMRAVPLRLGSSVGLLSSTEVTTGSDGRAVVTYTAPPLPPSNVDNGTIVTVSAVPTGTNFANAVARTVNIRLVPPAVVTPPPVAAFTVSPSTAMPNVAINFDASTSHADNAIAAYTWDFGDQTRGSGCTSQHTYGREGSYTVSLIITDSTGRTSYPTTRTVTVATGEAPTASFVVSPTTAAPNQTIFFNASGSRAGSGRNITDYAWDFGNGSTQHGVTVSTTYAAAGTYTVTLNVTDDAGRSATTSQSLTVTASGSSAPVANFVFSPAAPAVGQTVLFNASMSTAGQGKTLTTYSWDFGNGSTGTGATPSASFASAGSYTVTLTVTDSAGQTAVKTQAVVVAPATVASPTATFVFSPSSPAVSESVFFDASSSTAAVGHTIVSWAWNFGDTTTGTGRTFTKAAGYAPAATYTVVLTVTDDLGHTGTTSQSILVGSPLTPVANFSVSPSTVSAGAPLYLDARTSTTSVGQTITNYEWNFGDSTALVSTPNSNFTHTYAQAGTYTITLKVTDSAGRSATKTLQVTVNP